MNKRLQYALVDSFPNLYQGTHRPVMESNMAFGFEVGDGWFNILWELSGILEPLGVVASQVKEKYGTLRFYCEGATDEGWVAIDRAEERSKTECEVCGAAAELRTTCSSYAGWLYVSCDRHER